MIKVALPYKSEHAIEEKGDTFITIDANTDAEQYSIVGIGDIVMAGFTCNVNHVMTPEYFELHYTTKEIEMIKIKTKQHINDAIQYTGDNADDVIEFCKHNNTTGSPVPASGNDRRVVIGTMTGVITLNKGDYVITCDNGFMVCAECDFDDNYEVIHDCDTERVTLTIELIENEKKDGFQMKASTSFDYFAKENAELTSLQLMGATILGKLKPEAHWLDHHIRVRDDGVFEGFDETGAVLFTSPVRDEVVTCLIEHAKTLNQPKEPATIQ